MTATIPTVRRRSRGRRRLRSAASRRRSGAARTAAAAARATSDAPGHAPERRGFVLDGHDGRFRGRFDQRLLAQRMTDASAAAPTLLMCHGLPSRRSASLARPRSWTSHPQAPSVTLTFQRHHNPGSPKLPSYPAPPLPASAAMRSLSILQRSPLSNPGPNSRRTTRAFPPEPAPCCLPIDES